MSNTKKFMSVTASAVIASSLVAAEETDASTKKANPNDIPLDITQTYDAKSWHSIISKLTYPNHALDGNNAIGGQAYTINKDAVEKALAAKKKTANEPRTYTVKSGDTLSEIAYNHGISTEELMELNNLESTLIFPGDKFVLSKNVEDDEADQAVVAEAESSDDVKVASAVVAGAANGQVTTDNTLVASLELDSQDIETNAVSDPDSEYEPTVIIDLSEFDENEEGAATNSLGDDVDTLRDSNVSSASGLVGVGTLTASLKSEVAFGNSDARKIDYAVSSDESLAAISSKFGVSVSNLLIWNNLSPNSPIAGTTLTIHIPEDREPTAIVANPEPVVEEVPVKPVVAAVEVEEPPVVEEPVIEEPVMEEPVVEEPVEMDIPEEPAEEPEPIEEVPVEEEEPANEIEVEEEPTDESDADIAETDGDETETEEQEVTEDVNDDDVLAEVDEPADEDLDSSEPTPTQEPEEEIESEQDTNSQVNEPQQETNTPTQEATQPKEPAKTKEEPKPQAEQKPKEEPKPKAEPKPKPEPKPEPKPKPAPKPEPKKQEKPKQEPKKEEPKQDTSYSPNNLVNTAKSVIGTPYVWGGSTTSGFDCSGFIHWALNNSGKQMSRMSTDGYYNRSYIVNSPEVGDLVFFEGTYRSGISHMGIYVGNNQFIHASSSQGVTITSLDNSYWSKHFHSFKKFY